MPVFDVQTYAEGYLLPGVNQNAEQIAQTLQSRGIANAVLFSERAARVDPLTGNRILKALIDPFPALYGGVTAHLSRVDASIEAIRELLPSRRFVGTLLASDHPDEPLHPLLADETLNACRRYQKPIFVRTHNAECVEVALHLAKTYHMHKFVFLGMGGSAWRDAIAAAHQATNIFLETSGAMDSAKLPAAVEVIGAHRILFGSGSPNCDPMAALGLIAEARLTPNNLQRILFENVMKLFQLSDS